MKMSAQISRCGIWRYTLSRIWDDSLPVFCWIMLNPSVADAKITDPTATKIINFSKTFGAGGLVAVNLFAYRATDPMELVRASAKGIDVVGPNNDACILQAVQNRHVIAAWGTKGEFLGRDQAVIKLLADAGIQPDCLGTTKDGHPKHPLYLAARTPLVPFNTEV